MNEETKNLDHDLLIELRSEMKNIRADIKDLKDGTADRIKTLENDKADRAEVQEIQDKLNKDIEIRVRKLESSVSKFLLTLTLYSLAVGAMIALIVYHILSK